MRKLKNHILENVDCGILGDVDMHCLYVNREYSSPSVMLLSAKVVILIHDHDGKVKKHYQEVIQQLRESKKVQYIESEIEEELIREVDDFEYDTEAEAAGER